MSREALKEAVSFIEQRGGRRRRFHFLAKEAEVEAVTKNDRLPTLARNHPLNLSPDGYNYQIKKKIPILVLHAQLVAMQLRWVCQLVSYIVRDE